MPHSGIYPRHHPVTLTRGGRSIGVQHANTGENKVFDSSGAGRQSSFCGNDKEISPGRGGAQKGEVGRGSGFENYFLKKNRTAS
jgi:hypothetical protein